MSAMLFRDPFNKGFISWLIIKILQTYRFSDVENIYPNMSYFCTCHGSWAVMLIANLCERISSKCQLTHWGRATHICVSKLSIIASDSSLSPGRRQAIIWNNAGILSIGLLETNFSETVTEILTFSFKKMYLKMSSGKWRPYVSASMC